MDNRSDAQKLYETYGEAVNFKNYAGVPMPAWDELPTTIQQAWEQVASVAWTMNNPQVEFDEREKLQIDHAMNYELLYSKSGAPGHSGFMLMAKMAKALRYGKGY